MFDNYFANEGSNKRRTSSSLANPLGAHARSKQRYSCDWTALARDCSEEPETSGTFRKLLFEKVARPNEVSTILEAPGEEHCSDPTASREQ